MKLKLKTLDFIVEFIAWCLVILVAFAIVEVTKFFIK